MLDDWRLLWRDIKGALKPWPGELAENHRNRVVPGVFLLSLLLLIPLIVEHNAFGVTIEGRASYQYVSFSADRSTFLLGGRRLSLAQERAVDAPSPMYVVFCASDPGGPISGVVGRFSGIMMRSETRPDCGLFTGRWLPLVLLTLLSCTLMSLTRFRLLQYSAQYIGVLPAFIVLLLAIGWAINIPMRLVFSLIR